MPEEGAEDEERRKRGRPGAILQRKKADNNQTIHKKGSERELRGTRCRVPGPLPQLKITHWL